VVWGRIDLTEGFSGSTLRCATDPDDGERRGGIGSAGEAVGESRRLGDQKYPRTSRERRYSTHSYTPQYCGSVNSICNKDLLCIENRGCDGEEGFSTGVDIIKVRPKITILDHIPQSIP